MSYTQVNYEDVEPVAGGLYFLRDALDCSQLGVSVIDCDPGWTGKEHDHGEDGQEEVYVLVEGAAEMAVGGDTVALSQGDALRVESSTSRQIRNGETESRFVVVGAP
jgi:mannose-6-phosphate isomerase-like protein (cupin superfamily)